MSAPHLVYLFHWDKDQDRDQAPLVAKLREAGYDVIHHTKGGGLSAKKVSSASAVVIDLSRLPSHGRAVATWLRGSKSTRHIPLVFVDGEAEKVRLVKATIPDAVFTTDARLLSALRKAVVTPVRQPVVPTQMMAGYGSRTTAQKLGIGEGMVVRLIDPPANVLKVIGLLPDGVEFVEDGSHPLTLWFIGDPAQFKADLSRYRRLAKQSKLWVIWKKGNRLFNGNSVRGTALALGLVDYKICSIDSTWSGMLFAVKKAKP